MTGPPGRGLAELDFGWASHKAALGWLNCIFRRPRDFEAEVESTAARPLALAQLLLGSHFFPYYLLLLLAGRYFLLDILHLPMEPKFGEAAGSLFSGVVSGTGFYVGTPVGRGLVRYQQRIWLVPLVLVILLGFLASSERFEMHGLGYGIAIGIAFGIVFGLAVGIAFEAAFGLAVGFAFGLTLGIGFGIVFGGVIGVLAGAIYGVAFGVAAGVAFGSTSGIAVGVTFGLTLGIAFGIATEIVVGIAFVVAFLVMFLRLFYLPSHLWKLISPFGRRDPYQGHPLQADQCICLPLPWLDDLLMRSYAFDPSAANIEIERLIVHYPTQREAALKARVRLLARKAANLENLGEISAVLEALPAGGNGFFPETVKLQALAQEIALAAQRLEQTPRAYLYASYVEILIDKIETFRRLVEKLKVPYSAEFQNAAEVWKYRAETLKAKSHYLLPGGHFSVFRADLALDSEVDAYLPRRAVLLVIEEQVHLASSGASMVLIGPRRTGKSTLLNNLAPLVASRAEVLIVHMQSPRAFTSVSSLQALLHEKLESLLPGADLARPGDDLRSFETLLEKTDKHLARLDRKLLLAIDEYEAIDLKIAAGIFPVDMLALFRQSMQVHRRIKWIFVGSRSPEDLKGAPWTSYLGSTRLLEMPMFSREETRELLTGPMQTSSLFKDPAKRANISPSFWGGEEGITRLHEEAAGWPHLVQLLAQHTVELVNQEGRTGLNADLFARACTKAVSEGTIVFSELIEKDALPYLRQFQRIEEQDPPADLAIARSLRRRWLVSETSEGKFRLRVPLMRRWLQARG